MSLYTSPLHMFAASIISLAGLIWLATGRSPVAVCMTALRSLRQHPSALMSVLGVGAVLAVNALEQKLELLIAPGSVPDYTRAVASAGTGLLLALQRLEWAPLTHGLTYVYVILFPLLGIGSLIIYTAGRDLQALRRLFFGFLTNYLVALPFYLFVPVKEAWAAGVGVRFLIPQVYPAFEAQYRPFSGLDNCFPSLHTSLALTFALIAWSTGHRRLAMVLSVAAGLVVLSTLYLGVHWVPDAIAGAVLATAASGVVPLPALLTRGQLFGSASRS